MKRERYFEATEFQNIKEILYNSAKVYAENVAFVIKHKNDKDITYEDITYKKLLEDINAFGTKLYEMGFKNKRIAVVGRNRYEWVVAHLANVLGGIVSVALDKELQVDELESCLVRSKADVVVFDAYIMGDGKKSIAFTITITPMEKMSDSDLQNLQSAVIANVEKRCDAQIRDK